MAKISRQVREIIQIVVFLLIVGAVIYFYAIYPLSKTKAAMGRSDIDTFNGDSLVINNPAPFEEAGLTCDTFRVDADGLTNIAAIYITPTSPDSISQRGTACLLHSEDTTRDALVPLAKALADSGFSVIVYDQRASGRSTGKYHGEGRYEADDFEEIVRYLDIREKISHPFIVVGYGVGADAALLVSLEEPRIDAVIAIEPYLTTSRWLNILKQKHNMMWIPFFRSIMWWWYNMRSSYAAPYRQIDDLHPVKCPTLLLVPDSMATDPAVVHFQELSEGKGLLTKPLPQSQDELVRIILEMVQKSASNKKS